MHLGQQNSSKDQLTEGRKSLVKQVALDASFKERQGCLHITGIGKSLWAREFDQKQEKLELVRGT